MRASAWKGGSSASPTYGIRVGSANRDQFFDSSWAEIEVEIDGQFHTFALRPGFWNKCPEFRDRSSRGIRDWLRKHHTLKWPTGAAARGTDSAGRQPVSADVLRRPRMLFGRSGWYLGSAAGYT